MLTQSADVDAVSLGVLAGSLESDHGAVQSPDAPRRSGPASGRAISGLITCCYKLPQSSEEIRDPHNLFLEVWATAGVWAVLALAAALALAFWNLLGPQDRSVDEPTGSPRVERGFP